MAFLSGRVEILPGRLGPVLSKNGDSCTKSGKSSDGNQDRASDNSLRWNIRNETYPSSIAKAFGMRDAPTLLTRALRKSTAAVTELKYDGSNFGRTEPIPREDAYLVGLQFLPCLDHDLYFDDRFVKPTNWFPGVTTIYDLRRNPIADVRDPFHSLMFHLPRKALETLSYETGSAVDDLRHKPGVGIDDPVVRHLLSSLLPAMAKPQEAHTLFLEHVALALTVHVASTYGGMKRSFFRGGLAAWQEKRAKDLLTGGKNVSLSTVAAGCGLSVDHFARAFQRTTGLTPHRWLLTYRVDHSKDMLMRTGLSANEIALACGFADQSHFTRVFTKTVGCPPGEWRRRNRVAARSVEFDS